MPSRGRADPRRGISVSSRREAGCRRGAPAPVNKVSACGYAEPRTSGSEVRHQRQFAPGVGPRRQSEMVSAMRSTLFMLGAAACAAALTAGPSAQQNRDGGDIEVLPVHGSIYMIAGGGGKIAVSVGKDGVPLVDSGA